MEKEHACCGPDCCANETVVELSRTNTSSENIKQTVKARYSAIAEKQAGGCCDDSIQLEDYRGLEGYVESADLGLGCGAPTATDVMAAGDTVVDLGSGAGSDIFIARAAIGETGFALGVDFSPQMVELANQNAEKLGYDNTRFILADIEKLPIPDQSVDVITSNCVINLVPDKRKVFSEALRILKPGGHITISDVVTNTAIPSELKDNEALYCACVGGATTKDEYLALLEEAGFENVRVASWRTITLEQNFEEVDLSQIEVGGLTVVATAPTHSKISL